MENVVILAGGNIGDVKTRLEEVEKQLTSKVGQVVSTSKIHCSKAWGFQSQNDFLNRAFVVATALSAEELLDTLQEIEVALGRDREQEYREKLRSGEAYASRKIDLDILLYGDNYIFTERLKVPHPLIMQREFALTPLCEALNKTKEEVGKKVEQIIAQCK